MCSNADNQNPYLLKEMFNILENAPAHFFYSVREKIYHSYIYDEATNSEQFT